MHSCSVLWNRTRLDDSVIPSCHITHRCSDTNNIVSPTRSPGVRLQRRGFPCWERSFPRALQLDQSHFVVRGSYRSKSMRAAVELKVAKWKGRNGIPCPCCVSRCQSILQPKNGALVNVPAPEANRMIVLSAGPRSTLMSCFLNISSIPRSLAVSRAC